MMNQSVYKVFRLGIPNDESGDTGKKEFQDTGAVYPGFLETASAEFAAMNDGEFGKVYRFFIDDFEADIRIGDRLVNDDDANDIYLVSGVLKSDKAPARRVEIICHLPQP